MLFAANDDRYLYARAPLVEVICQLRFPTILSIGAKEPAEFQEAIRGDYPRYAVRQEPSPPKLSRLGTPNPTVQQQPPVTNYHFISQDGMWKINLTNNFIALSTIAYTQWEEFAQRLDKILAHFIRIHQPAFFERVGLRYLNAVSRKALGLEDMLWDDLIQSPYIGILSEPDVDENAVVKSALDVELPLEGGCHLKLHAGPGMLKRGAQETPPEKRFILDGDFSVVGSLPADQLPARMEQLHRHAVRLFQGAITRELHDAMGPMPL